MSGQSSKLLSLIFVLVVSSVVAGAQDLGSSNKLFKPKKSKTTTAPKRTTPVKKAATPTARRVSKPRSTPKRESSATRQPTAPTTKPVTTAVKPSTKTAKTAPIVPMPPAKIIIEVGKPTTGKYKDLFDEAIEEGNFARDERKYIQAESAYLRAQSLIPTDARAQIGLGNIYSDQQRWEEAERAFRRAIVLLPTSSQAHVALSFVLTQPIFGAEISDRYSEAEKLARRAIELDPKNALAHDQLGVSLELLGKMPSEVETSYRRAIAVDPAFALGYSHLSRYLSKRGRKPEADDFNDKAISLAVNAPTMILVAEVLQSQQRFGDSVKLLRRAVELDDRNPTALLLLGRAMMLSGDYNAAEELLQKSASVSVNSFVAYSTLSGVFIKQRKFPEAEEALENALRVVAPNEKRRLSLEFENLGDAYKTSGRGNDAVKAYKQASVLYARTDLDNKIKSAFQK